MLCKCGKKAKYINISIDGNYMCNKCLLEILKVYVKVLTKECEHTCEATTMSNKRCTRKGTKYKEGYFCKQHFEKYTAKNTQNITVEKKKSSYIVLGVSETDNFDTITRKYKELVRKTHPDKNPAIDPEKFKKISEAYRLIKESRCK